MAKTKYTFPGPLCPSCPYHQYVGIGVGETRYCKGFPKKRKPKRFSRSDPRYKPPKWCPRRLSPMVCRIYGFADEESEIMNWLLNREAAVAEGSSERDAYSVSEHHYKLRLEFPLGLTAKQFYDAMQSEPTNSVISEISTRAEYGEVIEIDDGLKPYYFYYTTFEVIPLPYFNRLLVQPAESKGGGRQ